MLARFELCYLSLCAQGVSSLGLSCEVTESFSLLTWLRAMQILRVGSGHSQIVRGIGEVRPLADTQREHKGTRNTNRGFRHGHRPKVPRTCQSSWCLLQMHVLHSHLCVAASWSALRTLPGVSILPFHGAGKCFCCFPFQWPAQGRGRAGFLLGSLVRPLGCFPFADTHVYSWAGGRNETLITAEEFPDKAVAGIISKFVKVPAIRKQGRGTQAEVLHSAPFLALSGPLPC